MSSLSISRREFLTATAVAGAGLCTGCATAAGIPPYRTRLKKALIRGLPDEKALAPLKAAGIEGVECTAWNANPAAAEKARATAHRLGMRIHSVLRGWCNFNHADSAQVEADQDSVRTALKTAALLGADAVLLVPCRVGGSVPKPWDYAYEFDRDTLHVSKVVNGDNARFADHIAAQNRATIASRKAVEELIPTAEESNVIIALENVWNNLWVKPDFFAAFVKSFDNPRVGAYLDLANHVKYAPTEQWVLALGDSLAKCHVKDFALNPNGKGGKFVHPLDGSVNWTATRAALDKIGYNGWLTIEGSGKLPLEELNRRLDVIIAG